MAQVELQDINKVYDNGFHAVKNANILIRDKEFVVLVGPSGCGKTTTLRMIAGLEDISGGNLLIDGKRVNNVPPKDRDIAMVFQNYALYPHMTVYDNMAFGLKIRKVPKDEIRRRVGDAARILDIEGLLDRKPKRLSGGQRQRVAVGRAIVRQPKVFLFDEPLSNLDAKLRVQMRAEISALHHRLQATMVYVTHDQVEAMTMGDKIVVMNHGDIQQVGDPMTLYNYPVNRFVAGFIGSPPMNFLTMRIVQEGAAIFAVEGQQRLRLDDRLATAAKDYVGRDLVFGIRPEDLDVTPGAAPDAQLLTSIEVVEPLGAETHLYANTGAQVLIARIDPGHMVTVGQQLALVPDLRRAFLFDEETGRAITVTVEQFKM